MKKIICLIVLLNLVIFGWSQDLVVAVTDFTARSGYTEDELSDITELFAGFLRDTGIVRVVTRSQWEAILKEHTFQRGGLVAQTEIRQLGVALGAQAVITGTLMKLGNSNVLNLSLLDVQSGEMLSAARNAFESLDEFLKLLPALSNDVVKLLKKPHPLIGRWKVDGKETIFTFNNDGTMTIQNATIFNSDVRWREFRRSGLGWVQPTIVVYEGALRGKYNFNDSVIGADLLFTGTARAIRCDDGLASGSYTNSATYLVYRDKDSVTIESKTLRDDPVPSQFDYRLINNDKLEIIDSLLLITDLRVEYGRKAARPEYSRILTRVK